MVTRLSAPDASFFHWPVASHVCGALLLHRLSPGVHTPVQLPALHTHGQFIPLVHAPALLQVCGVLPTHCIAPGLQTPPQAPECRGRVGKPRPAIHRHLERRSGAFVGGEAKLLGDVEVDIGHHLAGALVMNVAAAQVGRDCLAVAFPDEPRHAQFAFACHAMFFEKATQAQPSGGVGDLFDHLDCQDVVSFTGSASTAQKLRQHPAIIANSVRFTAETDLLNSSVLGPDAVAGTPSPTLATRTQARHRSSLPATLAR